MPLPKSSTSGGCTSSNEQPSWDPLGTAATQASPAPVTTGGAGLPPLRCSQLAPLRMRREMRYESFVRPECPSLHLLTRVNERSRHAEPGRGAENGAEAVHSGVPIAPAAESPGKASA